MSDSMDQKVAPPTEAIVIAGELLGLSMRLDTDALEKWLNTKPQGFRYEKLCRAAIAFKRAGQEGVSGAPKGSA